MVASYKALISACLIVGSLSGQHNSTALKGAQRLHRAPVNNEVLHVNLPRPVRTKLTNGLTLLVLERHKVPTITASVWIKTGALSDPRHLPGLASFTADMLSEGTSKRSSIQISKELDFIGGSLDADARFGQNVTRINVSGLSGSAEALLELMSDVVIHPNFPQTELDKYKKRRQVQLEEQRAQPGFLAREKFYRAVYKDFPASIIAPSPKSLAAVTVDDLRSFHAMYFTPQNAILAIAGDLTADQAKALAEKSFGAWKNHPVAVTELPPTVPANTSRIFLIDRPGSVQTNILIGNLSLKRVDPHYIPLRVLNRILGSDVSSRLFLNLREEKGYTYGAYSSVTANIYPGIFAASTEVRNPVTDGSLHELMAELRRIREEDVPPNELQDARRSIVAEFALSLEQPQQILEDWLTVEYYSFPIDYWDRYPEEVSKVTPAKIREVANKYIDLDHLQIVCVGDGKEIEGVLSKYGTVEATDADGNAVKLPARVSGLKN